MNKKDILALLDLAISLQLASVGQDGTPYVRVESVNYGELLTISIMDNGFEVGKAWDGEYRFYFDNPCSERMYSQCVSHITELLERIEAAKNE